MLIDTRAIGFALTRGILSHVKSRLEIALAPFARRLAGSHLDGPDPVGAKLRGSAAHPKRGTPPVKTRGK